MGPAWLPRGGIGPAQTRAPMSRPDEATPELLALRLAGVPVPGFTALCPAPLAVVFAEQATVSADDLCRLLPIDPTSLKKHVRAGHLSYLQVGFGRERTRWRFTLESIMRLIEERSVTECQSTSRPNLRFTPSTSGAGGNAMLARLARRNAEKQKQKSGS